jgi:solute carrier family 25 (mitochondrial citrate transporter), member 1
MQLSTRPVTSRNIISSTYSSGGILGFYRGLSSMVYFAAPKAAIRFSAFETCTSMLTGPNGEDKFNLGQGKGFVAGLGAGTMEAIFVTTPQETIKVRLVNDAFRTDGPPQYRSFFHGIKTIVGEYGLSGVYRGVVPTVIKVSTAQATRFGVFQCIPSEQRNTPIRAAASGAFAGGVSVLLFQGIDVVKSRMQGLDAHKYKSTIHCATELLRSEGPFAFYKGVGPRLTRVCLEVGITMSLYSEIVKALDLVWKTD